MERSLVFNVNAWDKFNRFLEQQNYSSIFLLCDENTNLHCAPRLIEQTAIRLKHRLILPSGEANKNLETCQNIWRELLEQSIDRKSLVIMLGGGIVCDVGGFCASTILRGVDFVYIPTSLMAMADAAIGGKNGINIDFYKNQIGSFNLPKVIVIDPILLNTLDDRQMKNGFVEMIKHALIESPSYISEFIESSWPIDKSMLDDWLRRSIRTKTEIIETDFKEQGIRKILNFGHTIGHALESYHLSKNRDVLHGECIAAGMMAELYLSNKLWAWRPDYYSNILKLLKPFAAACLAFPIEKNSLLTILEKDKKQRNQQILFSLLENPGKAKLDVLIESEWIEESIDFLYL